MYVDMDTSGAADLLTWLLPHSCCRFVLCPLFSIAPLHKYLAHAGLQTQVHHGLVHDNMDSPCYHG